MPPVLLVEDDDVIREAVRDLLEMEGFQVITAGNGRDALDMLRPERPPCLVLLDLYMPIMDGWQFLAAIEKIEAFADLQVVIFSAANDRSGGIGTRKVLRKPVNMSQLLSTVDKACKRSP